MACFTKNHLKERRVKNPSVWGIISAGLMSVSEPAVHCTTTGGTIYTDFSVNCAFEIIQNMTALSFCFPNDETMQLCFPSLNRCQRFMLKHRGYHTGLYGESSITQWLEMPRGRSGKVWMPTWTCAPVPLLYLSVPQSAHLSSGYDWGGWENCIKRCRSNA